MKTNFALPKEVTVNHDLGSFYPVIDEKDGKTMLGRWIGAVEVVVGGYEDDDGWEYITDYFPAYQLLSGSIVYVKGFFENGEPVQVNSLKGKMFSVEWGRYPYLFPEKWRYCLPALIAPQEGITTIEPDELPF